MARDGDRYDTALAVYRETSGEAWESVLPYLGRVDSQIVVHIANLGGCTSDEIEKLTGIKHQTISAQIRHMTEGGLLVPSGKKRPTRSGRGAIVWALCQRRREPVQAEIFGLGMPSITERTPSDSSPSGHDA